MAIELDTIYNEDCLVGMQQIPDHSIDAIICDLPYGTTSCAWDSVIPFPLLWEQYKRIATQDAPIILFGSEPFTSYMILSNVNWFREKLTWEKHKPSNMGNAKYMHLKYSEDIVVFSSGRCCYNPQMQPRLSNRVRDAQKGNSKQWRSSRKDGQEVSFNTDYAPKEWTTYNADYKYPSNVFYFPAVVSNSKEKTNHPTQKPVELLRYLVRTYTNEGDVVLDNCIGSGTTAIACIKEKRHYIGFELNEEYFNTAQHRINNERQQQTIF